MEVTTLAVRQGLEQTMSSVKESHLYHYYVNYSDLQRWTTEAAILNVLFVVQSTGEA